MPKLAEHGTDTAGRLVRVRPRDRVSVGAFTLEFVRVTHSMPDCVALAITCPAGTIVHIISWHDNSSINRFNPDAKNWVGNGQRTIDEMSSAWISWYYMSDEELKKEQELRRAQQGARGTR